MGGPGTLLRHTFFSPCSVNVFFIRSHPLWSHWYCAYPDYIDCPEVQGKTPIHKIETAYKLEAYGDVSPNELCGPLDPPSLGGAKYFQFFVAGAAGETEDHPCTPKSPSETAKHPKAHLKQFGKILSLRRDNGRTCL